MDPLYLALSYYKRRNYEKCKKITTELLENNPYDQAVWVLKMRCLTEEIYVDDVEAEEEGIADTFLNNDIIAESAKPGTSLLNPGKGTSAHGREMRPKSETGHPLTGVVRQNTQSARPKTMEQALKTPRTGRIIRPITSQNSRNIRLGTASMLSEVNGQFIEVSRLNLAKYAQGPTAKPLFEYLYYHENDVQHALQLAIEATQASNFKDWWWRVQLGKCYFTLNMIRDAETNFRLALNQHMNVDIYLRLIRVYIRLDQPLSAISVCKKGLEHFPNEVCLLTEIARLYESLNDMDCSIEYYRNVIKQDAVNIEAIACTAVHYFYSDQPEVALRFYKRLLQIGIVNCQLFNNLGLCCFYSQQFDLALGCFERALVLAEGEEVADVWYNLSHIAISVGDMNLACHCLRLCLAADGNHALAFNNLGVIELRRGRISQARAFFKIAERLAPSLFEPHFNLANMSYKHGDLQTSYIAVQKAVETNTTNSNCTELLNRVIKHFSSI
ncbi:UNVERIFIED_CONTAM: hypothetical protein PYX00_009733 [Menopon gallinae]|uniref:Tetratricopeptide repeat protein 8 n=1 Tax=Menopon gallinae TaxID=328185 RepID=A0AAW2HCX8_9NEOP